MKTINELEQEAQQARDSAIEALNFESFNKALFVKRMIEASVAMVTYQFAQADRLRNGKVIRIDDSNTYTFTVPIDATGRDYVYSNGEIRVVSGDTQSMESYIEDSLKAKLRRNEENASENYLHGDGSGKSLPEVSQEEKVGFENVKTSHVDTKPPVFGKGRIVNLPLKIPKQDIDSDVWIEWGGGNCPVDPDSLIIVKFRDGKKSCVPHKAGSYEWRRDMVERSWDIVAYKVAK